MELSAKDNNQERAEFRQKASVYTANQTLLTKTFSSDTKTFDDEYKIAYSKNQAYLKGIARSQLFGRIVNTIGEYFQSAVHQVNCGDATALLNEIDKFMSTDPQGKKANLIISFNASSFEIEGCNDLQKWIHYSNHTFNKLTALGENQSIETIMAIFKRS